MMKRELYEEKKGIAKPTKVCSSCGKELPTEAFNDTAGRRVHTDVCRECRLAKQKAKEPQPLNPVLHETPAEVRKRKKREYMKEWTRKKKLGLPTRTTPLLTEEEKAKKAEERKAKKREYNRKRWQQIREGEHVPQHVEHAPKLVEEKKRLCDTCAKRPCMVGFENFETLGYDNCRD